MGRTDVPATEPPQPDALPGSYALNVQDEAIFVWERRVSASAQAGEWQFVETLHRDVDPYLSLVYANLSTGNENGYWMYSRSYECKLGCD